MRVQAYPPRERPNPVANLLRESVEAVQQTAPVENFFCA
jgi:hypothetical protein